MSQLRAFVWWREVVLTAGENGEGVSWLERMKKVVEEGKGRGGFCEKGVIVGWDKIMMGGSSDNN